MEPPREGDESARSTPNVRCALPESGGVRSLSGRSRERGVVGLIGPRRDQYGALEPIGVKRVVAVEGWGAGYCGLFERGYRLKGSYFWLLLLVALRHVHPYDSLPRHLTAQREAAGVEAVGSVIDFAYQRPGSLDWTARDVQCWPWL